jgi:L-threonylcarbamoyladenylate synthase
VGLESTILDLSGTAPRLLRPGAIGPQALAEILGEMPLEGSTTNAPRVPGSLTSHYAPQTPLRLLETTAIAATLETLLNRGQRVALLAIRPPTMAPHACHWLAMPSAADTYAQQLYARLREADLLDCDALLVERPPTCAEWSAVQDRLGRAAAPRPGPGVVVETPDPHMTQRLGVAIAADKRSTNPDTS